MVGKVVQEFPNFFVPQVLNLLKTIEHMLRWKKLHSWMYYILSPKPQTLLQIAGPK